jgi:Uma2 family endonuclease
MSATATPPPKPVVHYPEDDGLPMSDNTQQMKWIFLLYGNLIAQYRTEENVFVAGNHLIYPVEGDNKTRQAPDAFVAFGRPKVDRSSYRVWEEGGIFPQVVFEVWSPSNRYLDMQDKFTFYEKYGAEEYYILYPEFPAHAEGFRREGGKLVRVAEMDGYVSPLTGLRFSIERGRLVVLDPHGEPLKTPDELVARREAAEREAEEQRRFAEEERKKAERESQRAEEERKKAEAGAEKAAKLAAKLRELGVDPDSV